MIIHLARVFFFICSLAAMPLAADASTLLNLRADVAAGKDARVALTFSGGTPNFRTYGNGTTDISLVLVATGRAANTAAAIVGKDSLKSINVNAVGDSLEVTFHEAVPATITVTVGSGQMLLATLSPAPVIAPTRRDGPRATPLPSPVPLDPGGGLHPRSGGYARQDGVCSPGR